MLFNKILVANRGEIAVRVMRTCREMGITTVAVYSEVDAKSLHVQLADEAVRTPSVRGYSDMDFMITTALQTGAEAIHPGYGFLAENPAFVDKCAGAGLVFIGPDARAIELMGDKSRARDTMALAGVPVTPGTDGVVEDTLDALRIARRIGFPVLVKAVAGGGGRGMRLAWEEGELGVALAAARSEANSCFGNPEVYLEKYMVGCRHVEIQILADNYGEVVYLGERDCSVQRRNQKLIEESPSPAVDPPLRAEMGRVAVAAAKAVAYRGAGTLEFLLDKDHKFYFMEMNTRIQVEHPVTELVCGLDLVREQIRLAAGEPLGYSQSEICCNGWAMECRVNAEDPETFLPSPGQISFYRPPGGFGVRLDSALFSGYIVSPYYDSLIAKVLVHAQTREEAMARMKRALEEFEVHGVKTTIPFHLRVLAHPDFQKGEFDTGFIAKNMAGGGPSAQNHGDIRQETTGGGVGQEQDAVQGSPLKVASLPGRIRPEVVAAISAALRVYGETKNQDYKIRGIQPTGRSCLPWRLAGLYDRMGRI